MIKDTLDPTKPNVIDLKSFRFPRKKGRPPKKVKFPERLIITINWTEYDCNGDPIEKIITWEVEDTIHTLSYDGKKQFIEKCFNVIGHMYDSDPSLARELEERLGELYDKESKKK